MPTWVEASSGGINGGAVTATRPTGTQVGDHLFLVYSAPSSETTPATLSGWTKLSGYDQFEGGAPKFVIYDRIADLTATDQPSIAGGSWFGGWAMVAIRGGSTISVPVVTTGGSSSATMLGPVVTTTAPNSLILSLGLADNNRAVSAPTGGPTDRHRANANWFGTGIATEDKTAAGAGAAPSWTLSGGTHWRVYALALTA